MEEKSDVHCVGAALYYLPVNTYRLNSVLRQ